MEEKGVLAAQKEEAPDLPSAKRTRQDCANANTAKEDYAPSAKTNDVDTWDTDPENGYNWSFRKKLFHTAVPAGIAFRCALSSSINAPAVQDAVRHFHVSAIVAILPLSFFIVGMAFGPLLSAPFSETLGRRTTYFIFIPLFALFTLGSGLSQSIYALTICRFFAGFFASPGLNVGSPMLADIWKPAERALPTATYVALIFLGPTVGPLIGGAVTQGKSWKWTQWVILFSFILLCLPAVAMREIYKKIILKRRAGPQDLAQQAKVAKAVFAAVGRKPVHMLLTEPIIGLFSLYIAFTFAVTYSFYTACPTIFGTQYGFDLTAEGLPFLGTGVGVFVGFPMLVMSNQYLYMPRVVRWRREQAPNKTPPAEWRLFIAFPATVVLPAALFLFGWTAEYRLHWIGPVTALAMFGCGMFLILMSATMYIMDCYGPLYGASAMAGNTMLRYILGSIFPLFTLQMYERLGIGWASSLLGFICLALGSVPWIFLVFGERLRKRQGYKNSN